MSPNSKFIKNLTQHKTKKNLRQTKLHIDPFPLISPTTPIDSSVATNSLCTSSIAVAIPVDYTAPAASPPVLMYTLHCFDQNL